MQLQIKQYICMSSSIKTVLDIRGYNFFTLQCGVTFSPTFEQMLFTSFEWTRNGVSYTNSNKEAIPLSKSIAFKWVRYNKMHYPQVQTHLCTTVLLCLVLMVLWLLVVAIKQLSLWRVSCIVFCTVYIHICTLHRSCNTNSSSSTPTTSDLTNICSDTMECSWSDLLSWTIHCLLHYQQQQLSWLRWGLWQECHCVWSQPHWVLHHKRPAVQCDTEQPPSSHSILLQGSGQWGEMSQP